MARPLSSFRRPVHPSTDLWAAEERQDLVEGLSVDEAFLDVTGSQGLFGDGEAIARRIKEEIKKDIRLTASAGVAPSKFVAKIASESRPSLTISSVTAVLRTAWLYICRSDSYSLLSPARRSR